MAVIGIQFAICKVQSDNSKPENPAIVRTDYSGIIQAYSGIFNNVSCNNTNFLFFILI